MTTKQPKQQQQSQNKTQSNHELLEKIARNTGRRRRGRGRRRYRGRYRRFSRTAMVPSAFTSTYNANAFIRNIRGVPALHSQEVFPIKVSRDPVAFMLPLIPSKWVGTRSAALASTYTSFRPLSVEILYQPSVGTGTSGNLIFGTVFDGASVNLSSLENSVTSLPATNGGFITQLYQPMSSKVGLATALRYNLFPLYNIGEDDIPLWLVVATQTGLAVDTSVGNLVVRIKASLKNPSINPAPATSGVSIPLQFVHDNDTNKTTLYINKTLISQALALGRDYLITFGKDLLNLSGAVIFRALQSSSFNLSAIGENAYQFNVDPRVATANIIGTLIGPSSAGNF